METDIERLSELPLKEAREGLGILLNLFEAMLENPSDKAARTWHTTSLSDWPCAQGVVISCLKARGWQETDRKELMLPLGLNLSALEEVKTLVSCLVASHRDWW